MVPATAVSTVPPAPSRSVSCVSAAELPEGGAAALWSEVWLCRRCHSLVHSGSLAVRGDPLAGLEWTPRAMDLTEGVRGELERTRSLPEVRTVERALSGHPDSSGRQSGHPDSFGRLSGHPDGRRRVPAPGDELREVMEDVVAGLRGLGWTKEEATTRVAGAGSRAPTCGALLASQQDR